MAGKRTLRDNPVPKTKPAIVAQPKPVEVKPVEAPKPVEIVKVEPTKRVEPVKPPVVTEPVQPPKVDPPPPPTVKRRPVRALQTLKAGNRAKAKTYFYEGVALQQQGKLPAAISSYTKAVATELMRVTWPSWEDVRVSTIAVVVASLVAAVLLFGMDTLSYNLMVKWLPAVWGKLG